MLTSIDFSKARYSLSITGLHVYWSFFIIVRMKQIMRTGDCFYKFGKDLDNYIIFTDYIENVSEASDGSHSIEGEFHVNNFSCSKVSCVNSCKYRNIWHIWCVIYCPWWMDYLSRPVFWLTSKNLVISNFFHNTVRWMK